MARILTIKLKIDSVVLSALFIRKKSFPINWKALRYAAEKIRTPDTLVRSQVLYPAELHVQRKYYNSAAVMKSQALFLFFYIFIIEAPSPVLDRSKC